MPVKLEELLGSPPKTENVVVDGLGAFLGQMQALSPPSDVQPPFKPADEQPPVTPPIEIASMTPEGLDRLRKDEGDKLIVYKDTKKKDTIGVGFNLEAPENRELFESVTGFSVEEARKGKPITPEQSAQLLALTVERAEAEARKLVRNWEKLEPAQRDALVNFTFNLGLKKAKGFKDTLAAIERGDGKAAAREVLNSRYAKQVGERAKRVSRLLATISKEQAADFVTSGGS